MAPPVPGERVEAGRAARADLAIASRTVALQAEPSRSIRQASADARPTSCGDDWSIESQLACASVQECAPTRKPRRAFDAAERSGDDRMRG